MTFFPESDDVNLSVVTYWISAAYAFCADLEAELGRSEVVVVVFPMLLFL
jgi:hypothetical protein